MYSKSVLEIDTRHDLVADWLLVNKVTDNVRNLGADFLLKNDESHMEVIHSYQLIIDLLSERMKSDNISFDEEKFIVEQMINVADKKAIRDTENKQ